MASRVHESERRRSRDARRGRHRASAQIEPFTRGFSALGELAASGAQVSLRINDITTGEMLMSADDHVVVPTASIGKVLLLIEVAARLGDADWLDGAFSAGDLLMVTVLRRLGSSGLLEGYPNLSAYVARGEARPAYRRAFDDQLAVYKAASGG